MMIVLNLCRSSDSFGSLVFPDIDMKLLGEWSGVGGGGIGVGGFDGVGERRFVTETSCLGHDRSFDSPTSQNKGRRGKD